jgi:hypothetical protein
MGLPFERVRRVEMKRQRPRGVEKASWYGGEAQSSVQGPKGGVRGGEGGGEENDMLTFP